MGSIGKKNESGYTPEFLELERRKRYGYANKVEETEEFYRIWMLFPTVVPPCELRDKLGIPAQMPDYEYDIALEGNTLTVRARLKDERVLKLTGLVNSFPDRFFKEFILDKPACRFEASYESKVLDITVFKSKN